MTECVQRHDVAPESGEAILAEMDRISREADRALWVHMAWIVGPVAVVTLALYLAAVLT